MVTPKYDTRERPAHSSNFVRYILGSLLLLVALNAFGGGYYGMAGAKDVPTIWLQNTPFKNYFIPSLILFLVVGGSALLAAFAVFRHHRNARLAALISGLIVLVWIAVQVAMIGYVSWMQPVTAIAGFFVLLLTWRLSKYER
jgi:hypothetical protein